MGVGVLGPLTVDGVDGQLRRHDRVVLAALASRPGHVVSAEVLADALWGGDVPTTWTKVVQGCVVRLRKALGPEAIETTPQGYRLALPPDDVDLRRFERLLLRGRELLALAEPERAAYTLDEALALWRGRALVELDAWEVGRFEAARLDELRLEAEELRVDAALRAGHSREMVGRAQALTAEAPLRERRWALLALAQYQAGQQADALRTLRTIRGLLARELGLDPGPELVALEEAILNQDPALAAAAALGEPSDRCPYRGLVPFDVGDVDSFFGRDREVADCRARLARDGVLVVVGPSGSGKSSLARAGLAAALERDGRRVVVVSPGEQPLEALTALDRPGQAPVLVVDQCEEAVSSATPLAERAAFFDALCAHSERAELVVAFRADRLGEISAYPEFARLVERGLFMLGPMGEDDLRAVIERPAKQAGLLIEPGLVDLLVLEVDGEPAALPLLSHALRETWSNREGRTLTVEAYQATGGIRAAIARSAEEVYEDLTPEQQGIVRDLFLRLVAPGDGEPTRNRVPRRIFADDRARDGVIERLVAARLVVADDGVLELAHESVIRAWPRVRQWLAEDAGGQQILRHLSAAADSWESMGRPHSELYRGVRLAEALDWEAGAHPDLTPVEASFLRASEARVEAELTDARARARADRRARTRTRKLAAALAGALALALVAAAVAITYQRQASQRAADADASSLDADANRLAALSTSVRSLDMSLLLAAQAVRMSETPGTADGLLDALVEHRRATQVLPLAKRPTDAGFADHGRVVFMAAPAEVGVWSPGSSDPPTPVNTWGHRFDEIATSPTDPVFALWSYRDDATPRISVRDAQDEALFSIDGFAATGGFPKGLSFSPDGRLLYTSALRPVADGHLSQVAAYDARTGAERWTRVVQRTTGADEFPVVDIDDDGMAAVSWPQEKAGPATITPLDAGSPTPVPVAVVERSADCVRYVALRTGAAQIWADGVVSLYGLDGTFLQTLQAHQREVTSIAVSPDGSWSATGDRGGTIVVWDVDPESGEWVQRETLTGHDGQVSSLAIDPVGTTLLSASDDGTAITWDMSGDAGFGAAVRGLGDSWISNRPAVLESGLVVAPTRPAPDADAAWWQQTMVSATFIDPRTGRVVDSVPLGDNMGSLFGSSAAVSPDGSLVAVTYSWRTAILDVETRTVVARVTLPDVEWYGEQKPEPVWCSAWTPDGSRLLLCADGAEFKAHDGNLVVVDTDSWQVEPDRVGIGGAAQTIELSPDGSLLAVGMTLPDVDNPPPGTVKLLDADTLEPVRVLRMGVADFPYDLSFSPDGSRLAVGADSGNVFTFDVATGEPLHGAAKVNNAFVQQVEWLPDGRTVVSTGADGTITLFDAERGLVRTTMPAAADGAAGYTYLLDVSADSLTAVAGEHPGRVYPLGVDTWFAQACAVVRRDLTADEWASYLPGRPYEATCGSSLT